MLELVFWFLKFTAFVKLTENTIVNTSPQITAMNYVLLFIILKFKLILNSNSHYKCTIIFYTRKIYNKRITYLIFYKYFCSIKIQISMKKLFYRLLLFMLIAFFTYTLVHKLMGLDSFLHNIVRTGLFNGSMVDMVAYGAISAELLSIILLLFYEKIGLLFSWAMIFSFTIYILILYLMGRYEVCGCGGILNGLAFHWHILINSLVIIILSFLIYEKKNSSKA